MLRASEYWTNFMFSFQIVWQFCIRKKNVSIWTPDKVFMFSFQMAGTNLDCHGTWCLFRSKTQSLLSIAQGKSKKVGQLTYGLHLRVWQDQDSILARWRARNWLAPVHDASRNWLTPGVGQGLSRAGNDLAGRVLIKEQKDLTVIFVNIFS